MIRSTIRFSHVALLAAFAAAPVPSAAGEMPRPIPIVVFDFELDDFTAGGPIAGESAEETARLGRVTRHVREELTASGRYQLVDPTAVETDTMRQHWLRNCNACDADIAQAAGAEQSLLGIFRKLSVMQQMLEFQIRDAKTGRIIAQMQTDLRGETDESWTRAATWLIKNRVFADGKTP